MRMKYERPEAAVIYFETEDVIAASGDYDGINFMDLIWGG